MFSTKTYFVCILLMVFSSAAFAQPSPKGSASGAASTQASTSSNQTGGTSSGSGGLQGISYARESWAASLKLPNPKDLGVKPKGVVVLCYDLVPGNSAAQPFILQASPATSGTCANVNTSKPLLMNQILVISINMAKILPDTRNRFRILNLNITNQQGSSLNPTPIRPSLAAGTASGTEGGTYMLLRVPFSEETQDVYYLTWPNQIPGDTIPTVSVNLVYTPVAPALPFQPNTFYPAGSIVISDVSSATNGHYYVAVNGGISSGSAPNFDTNLVLVPTSTTGSGISWKDMGQAALTPTPPAWQANTAYAPGALVITSPSNNHYYRAQSAGRSDSKAPGFPVDRKTITEKGGLSWQDMGFISFVNPAPPAWTASTAYAKGALVVNASAPNPTNGHYYQAQADGVTGLSAPPFHVDGSTVIESTGVTLVDVGPTLPASAKLKAWTPDTAYFVGDVIQGTSSGHYYSVTQAGISEHSLRQLVVPAPQVVPGDTIQWQDLGTTLPASVSVGIPSSDQTVNLLTYTFPQAHALSYFNLASGVVVSSIKSRSFYNNGSAMWATATSGPTVDPILAVTGYVFGPMDAERPWHPKDLVPGITIGFSLTSPTTNFYFGGSSELFIRNLQVVYGLSLYREATLYPSTQAVVGTSPATSRQTFFEGGFAGLSFNITGFIQSLIP